MKIDLYLYAVPGCPTCAKAKKELEKLRRLRPWVWVEEIDATTMEDEDWHDQGFTAPENAPAYALLVDDGVVKTWGRGMLTLKQLEGWIDAAIGGGE